jgi:nitrite reductase/ring-hydroxylating ferredoxin subunit
MKRSAKERFEEKILYGVDGCWHWTAAWTQRTGYGKFTLSDGSDCDAHRASFKIYKGEIPDGLCVRHTCDNKLCVNPDHLLLGTQAENIKDSVNRGRNPKGESSGQSKVTEFQVKIMREAYDAGHKVKHIAKYFGLKDAQTYCIVTRKAWAHVY